jgi:hypothetical protein
MNAKLKGLIGSPSSRHQKSLIQVGAPPAGFLQILTLQWPSHLLRIWRFRKEGVFSLRSGKGDRLPRFFSEADAVSSIFTTCRPFSPLLRGWLPFSMQSRKCWHSILSGSSCLSLSR